MLDLQINTSQSLYGQHLRDAHAADAPDSLCGLIRRRHIHVGEGRDVFVSEVESRECLWRRKNSAMDIRKQKLVLIQ